MGRSVVVAGSGAAGLGAALATVKAGAEVTVLERLPHVDGSTGLSGGIAWIPPFLETCLGKAHPIGWAD